MALRGSFASLAVAVATSLLAGAADAGQVEGDGHPAGPTAQRPTLVAVNTYHLAPPDRVAARVAPGLAPSERRSVTPGQTRDRAQRGAEPLGASALVTLLGDAEARAAIQKQEIAQSLRRQLEAEISIREKGARP